MARTTTSTFTMVREKNSFRACFTAEEVETYMRLLLEQPDSGRQRLRMMEEKRKATLDEIHFHERQLQRLDYLRHELQKEKGV